MGPPIILPWIVTSVNMTQRSHPRLLQGSKGQDSLGMSHSATPVANTNHHARSSDRSITTAATQPALRMTNAELNHQLDLEVRKKIDAHNMELEEITLLL